MSTFGTALDIVNDAALLLGLRTQAYAVVFTSTDANAVLLRNLLNATGRDLERSHHWTQLEREHTFSTFNGGSTYDLPAGYSRLIPRTQWNRSDSERLGPPLSAQGWQYLRGSNVTLTIQTAFRIQDRQIRLFPTPTSTETVALEYLSSYWVQPDGEDFPQLDAAQEDDDTIWFDRLLMVYRLRRDFLRAKGFDSTSASEDYERVLASVLGGDGEAPVITVGGNRFTSARSQWPRLPDTFTG